MAVAVDGSAKAHDQRHYPVKTVELLFAEAPRIWPRSCKQLGNGFCQFVPHPPRCGAGMLDCAFELSGFWREAAQQETITHCADDAVVRIDHAGGAEDESDLAFPRQGLAAFGAEVACPCAVIDLA